MGSAAAQPRAYRLIVKSNPEAGRETHPRVVTRCAQRLYRSALHDRSRNARMTENCLVTASGMQEIRWHRLDQPVREPARQTSLSGPVAVNVHLRLLVHSLCY